MNHLITKTEAINLLGISSKAFSKLQIQPVETKKNPYRKNGFMYLYDQASLLSLVGTKVIDEVKPKIHAPKDYYSVFNKRYKDKTMALAEACFAMFNLNRYAKNQSCAKANKEEIYELKNQFIERLYKTGFCCGIQIHTISRYVPEWFNRELKVHEGGYTENDLLYSFEFNIDNQMYNWHQPEETILFDIPETDISCSKDISEIKHDKPIMISRNKLTEAKRLIQWYLSAKDN